VRAENLLCVFKGQYHPYSHKEDLQRSGTPRGSPGARRQSTTQRDQCIPSPHSSAELRPAARFIRARQAPFRGEVRTNWRGFHGFRSGLHRGPGARLRRARKFGEAIRPAPARHFAIACCARFRTNFPLTADRPKRQVNGLHRWTVQCAGGISGNKGGCSGWRSQHAPPGGTESSSHRSGLRRHPSLRSLHSSRPAVFFPSIRLSAVRSPGRHEGGIT
jgi:hypothetical protein